MFFSSPKPKISDEDIFTLISRFEHTYMFYPDAEAKGLYLHIIEEAMREDLSEYDFELLFIKKVLGRYNIELRLEQIPHPPLRYERY